MLSPIKSKLFSMTVTNPSHHSIKELKFMALEAKKYNSPEEFAGTSWVTRKKHSLDKGFRFIYGRKTESK